MPRERTPRSWLWCRNACTLEEAGNFMAELEDEDNENGSLP